MSVAPGKAVDARDEAGLLDAIEVGSVEAFLELYDRYCDRAYRLAMAICGEDGRAQDAVHEVFIALWRGRRSLRSQPGTLAARLLSTVERRATELTRHAGADADERSSTDRTEVHGLSRALAAEPADPEPAAGLPAMLALLPAPEREVITLAYYGQLSHTEIAVQLGLPPGTVKGRMRLGLHELRRTLERRSA